MWGKGWEDLMNAVKQFMTTASADVQLQAKSRVSIITYDDKCFLIRDQQIPHLNVANNIEMNEGGTDFEKPLNMALNHMQVNNAKYQSFVVCMMTDGQADYPANAVNAILRAPEIVAKLKFKAVAYTGGSDSLQQIAKNLNGEFVTALLANQLANAFISLVARKQTAKAAAPLWDPKQLAVGQVLSMRTYYNVKIIAENTLTVEDQNGTTMQVSRNIVEKMASGTHFAKEVPMTMTGLAELLEGFSDTVF